MPNIRSLTDLARIVGVSPSTASRALADNPVVAKATRRKIQQIARQSGFSVNPAARSLRTKTSNTIGLILPLGHEKGQHLSDPFFTAMFSLLAEEVSERGYDLLLKRVEPTRGDWLEKIVASRRVDGVIVIGQSDQAAVLDDVATSYRPMVVWGQWLPSQRYISVGVDNVAAGSMVGRHLAGAGRTHLAFCGNIVVPEFKARHDGFLMSLPDETRRRVSVVPTHLTFEASYAAATDYLRAHPETDGVFAASDVIAMSFVRAAIVCGLRVPEDLSVIGFDDVAVAVQNNPPLTTIRQDLVTGSRLLCERLFQLLNDERCTSVILPPQLILRASA